MRTYDHWIDGSNHAWSGGGLIERRFPAAGKRLAAFAASLAWKIPGRLATHNERDADDLAVELLGSLPDADAAVCAACRLCVFNNVGMN